MKKTSVELGKKIKDIKINQKKYRWFIFSMLIVFNLILVGGIVYLCVNIPKWYIFTIVSVVWALCLAESVRVFVKSKSAYKYKIYEKCLLIQTIYSKYILKLENVYLVETKTSLADKMAGDDTYTLIVHVKDNVREIVKLPFVNEDSTLLTQTIMQMATENREPTKNTD